MTLKTLLLSSLLPFALLAGCGDKDVDSSAPDDDGDGATADVDCDDADASAYPGAAEVCDGVDNDCDGMVDNDPTDGATFYSDGDNDGYGAADQARVACEAPANTVENSDDCDDGNAGVYPGADEYCDDVDNNCDGTVDEPGAIGSNTVYADTDGDGFGDANNSAQACASTEGYVNNATDCDDADANSYPNADETCDDIDNDCDNTVDEDSIDGATWYRDYDEDGYGRPDTTTTDCTQPDGYSATDDDCDDFEAAVSPGASETCDGVDNNCDGSVDESTAVDASVWYEDLDADGYGDAAVSQSACEQPSGYVSDATDCDDVDTAVNPGATEVCDSLDTDEDCSGSADDADSGVDVSSYNDWYADPDGDGYGEQDSAWTLQNCDGGSGYAITNDDCDEADATINPGATEVWYDGVDQNCDALSDYDADADGYDSDAHGGDDCDDALAATNPGATEVWYDGVDTNCDTWSDYDADQDNYDDSTYGGTDCDDADAAVHPYALELPTETDSGDSGDSGDSADTSAPVDYDCDGGTDSADPDVIVYPDGTDLTSDDGELAVTFTAFTFPLCGTTYTDMTINTNGQLWFGTRADANYDDFSESTDELLSEGASINPWWDDFNTASQGDIYYVEYVGALGVYWEDVTEWSEVNTNTFSVILFDDGTWIVDYGTMESLDGISGWSCGTDSTDVEVDVSAALGSQIDGAAGIGQGTESSYFELFDSEDNDLAGWSVKYCGTSGTDGDADGWTDNCGDSDDADANVYPQ